METLSSPEGWASILAREGEPALILLGEADLPPERGRALLSAVAALPAGDPHLTWGAWLLRLAEPSGEGLLWQRALVAQALGPLRRRGGAALAIQEADDLDPRGGPIFRAGASRALRLALAQERALLRWGIGPGPMAPWAGEAALACARVDGAEGFFAQREAPKVPGDSGWRFGCLDPEHLHRGSDLRVVTAGHLLGRFPELAQYLAFEAGWVISRDAEGYWVTPPGEPNAYQDQGHEPTVPWHRGVLPPRPPASPLTTKEQADG
jgi:hypothetical protein